MYQIIKELLRSEPGDGFFGSPDKSVFHGVRGVDIEDKLQGLDIHIPGVGGLDLVVICFKRMYE